MDYIDPHIHMVSRITDDYETLARMGCVAMSEPAFCTVLTGVDGLSPSLASFPELLLT